MTQTFDETRFVQRFENNRELSICACWYWIRKLQAGVFVQRLRSCDRSHNASHPTAMDRADAN